MRTFEQVGQQLTLAPKKWLVTGVAGFIGSNLLETLLKLNQTVIGLDNFATGYQKNLDEVKGLVSAEQWGNFTFIEGDIRDFETCQKACSSVDYDLHQAPGVKKAIDEFVANNNYKCSIICNDRFAKIEKN